uniref:CCHC-type domain-containing protein n=1 Tax=Bracon brevicornis TaxID=1563983 RepID=A0A6V7IKY9_9HYME
MRQMDDLLTRQLALAELIDKFKENTSRIGPGNVNPGYLRSRHELLTRYWADFQQNHQTLLCSEELVNDEYFISDRYSLVELSFSDAMGHLYNEGAEQGINSTAHHGAAPMAGPPLRQAHLPKIQLPRFSGKLEEWESFRDMFKSLVHLDQTLTPVQKLHFLMTSLEGSAKQALHGLTITDANYSVAWDLLLTRYDNPQLRTYQHMQALVSLSSMRAESGSGLQTLHDDIARHRGALMQLELPVQHWDQWFIFFATKAMDSSTRREWEKRAGKEQGSPTYETLTTFLQEYARTLKAIELTTPKRESEKQRNDRAGKSQAGTSRNSRQHTKVLTTTPGTPECPACKSRHYMSQCEKFKGLSVPERRRVVRDHSLCFVCLETGHAARMCTSRKRCDKCGSLHHTLVHTEGLRKRPAPSKDQEGSAEVKRARTVAAEVVATSSAPNEKTD